MRTEPERRPANLAELYRERSAGENPHTAALAHFLGEDPDGIEQAFPALPWDLPRLVGHHMGGGRTSLSRDLKDAYNTDSVAVQENTTYLMPDAAPDWEGDAHGIGTAFNVAQLTAGASAAAHGDRVARVVDAYDDVREKLDAYRALGDAAFMHRAMINAGESTADDFYR